VSEILCAKQEKDENNVTRYVSRLSTLFWVLTYVVWVLETEKRKEPKDLARCSQISAQSGTPDSVRWRTGHCPVRQARLRWTGRSRESLAAYDYNSPDCLVVHQTVRWANGRQRNGRPRNPRAMRGPHQRSAGVSGLSGVHWTVSSAPQPRICNGHLRQNRKEIAHRTWIVDVRWCTGLSGAPPGRRQG
jgi:hypothetical protein